MFTTATVLAHAKQIKTSLEQTPGDCARQCLTDIQEKEQALTIGQARCASLQAQASEARANHKATSRQLKALGDGVVAMLEISQPQVARALPRRDRQTDPVVYAGTLVALLRGQGQGMGFLADTLELVQKRHAGSRQAQEQLDSQHEQAVSDEQTLRLELERLLSEAQLTIHRAVPTGHPARNLLKRQVKPGKARPAPGKPTDSGPGPGNG